MEIKVDITGLDLNTVVGSTYSVGSSGGPDPEPVYSPEPQTLGDVVVDQIVAKLAREDSAWRGLTATVAAERTDEIRRQLTPIVTEAINGPIQRTNAYGEPMSGVPTTLREMIVQEVQRVVTANNDRYGKGNLLQEVIKTEVERAMRSELQALIVAEKAKVIEAIQAEGAAFMTNTIKAAIGLR